MDYVEATQKWLERYAEINLSKIKMEHDLIDAPVGTPDEEEERVNKISGELLRMETLVKKLDDALDRLEEIEDAETKFLIESHYKTGVPLKDLSKIADLPETMIRKKLERGVKIMAGLLYGVALDFMRD